MTDDGSPGATSEPASNRTRLLLVVAAALVLAAAIAAAVVLAGGGDEPAAAEGFATAAPPPPRRGADVGAAARAAGCTLRLQVPSEGRREVVEPVTYRADPPHSGDHWPEPAAVAAYYDEPPPTEALVHSLLHGRVILWFDPDLDEDDKGRLKGLYDEDTHHVILTPRESMPSAVAATAWRKTMTCPELGEEAFHALRAFRAAYRDQGLEFVP